MRIALAQIDPTLGAFKLNQELILNAIRRAHQEKCDLVIFPESALFGYHPVDLLERPALVREQEACLHAIHEQMPDSIGALVGAITKNPTEKGKAYWNAAVFLEKGQPARAFAKQLLPMYDVFDEGRHIEPGETARNILHFKGRKILVTVCEDIWAWKLKKNPWYAQYGLNPLLQIQNENFNFVVNLSASPFTMTKLENRRDVATQTAKHFGCPLVYVNMVGGQDELIFDGGSFVVNPEGKIELQCHRFQEDFSIYDLTQRQGPIESLTDEPMEVLRSALTLGIRDFVRKTGFKKVHLGLSGGIDSALVACLAVDAVGAENVTAVFMPGPFTSSESGELSRQLVDRLNVRSLEFSIQNPYENVVQVLESALGRLPFGVVHENIQSRLRGMMLMALANMENSLLLGTSNKSELAVGYSTLYGDMIGGIMPIGDLLKTEVYELARYYNRDNEVIPTPIIERAPSAELRPNQKDQDSLPPYDALDEAVRRLVIGVRASRNPLERQVLSLMMKSEFKRWQAPPVLKVSDHAFGRGRRFPIAHHAAT